MQDREAAVHFYEMLTGVFNDEQSKIVRYVCFGVLFLGMMWAGFNYFRASILADTKTPLDEELFQDTQLPGNEATLRRIAELAQAVDTMRRGSDSIAETLEGIHNMPFNLSREGTELDPFAQVNSVSGTPESVPMAQENVHSHNVPLNVKMIMTADNGDKVAVVDVGREKGVVLKRGDKLPDESGFVSSIRPNGITLMIDKKEVSGELSEIPMFKGIKKSR